MVVAGHYTAADNPTKVQGSTPSSMDEDIAVDITYTGVTIYECAYLTVRTPSELVCRGRMDKPWFKGWESDMFYRIFNVKDNTWERNIGIGFHLPAPGAACVECSSGGCP